MLKRTYTVIYRIRCNKKTSGVRHVINLTFFGKLKGSQKNQAKLLKTLCSIHRVNPDAVLLERAVFVSWQIAGVEWAKQKLERLFRQLRRLAASAQ